MARPIVLSNGEMNIGINEYGLVHDFYYPYVGLENHSAGNSLRHRIGVMAEGTLSWLDDGNWQIEFSYPHRALVGHTVVRNDAMGIIIEFDDAVDSEMSAFVRNIHVINTRGEDREIRLFMHQAFVIGDSRSNTDTVQYLPDPKAILHYRGRRVFLVSAKIDDEYFDQHSVGLFGIEGHEGTFRDADDGELSMGNVEHGRVDSTIRCKFKIRSHDSARVHYWIAAGTSTREALFVYRQVEKSGIDERLAKTQQWWQQWFAPAKPFLDKIDPAYQKIFAESLMIVKSQIDKRGAVIASTDSALLKIGRDAYGYCWPRDGSLALWPFIRMGFKEEPRQFFEFCRRGLHPGGYLMHKYRADGALGSSWHPYVHADGEVAAPIQEDETALTLFMFAEYYHLHAETTLLKEFYEPMVLPMAQFLASYVDRRTSLPKPTYDLWEERYLTTTYTTAITYAALHAAADIADAADDKENAMKWRISADEIANGARKHLFSSKRKYFKKGVYSHRDGHMDSVDVIDSSSVFGAFMFGLFPADSREIKESIETLEKTFGNGSDLLLLPRYEQDYYLRAHPETQGNIWFITVLWLTQYYLEIGETEKAKAHLDWVSSHALGSGVLSEQVDPLTGAQVSVAPLTWSHAELLNTLLDTIKD